MRKRSTFGFTAFVTIIAVVCIVFAAISFFDKKDGITLTKDQNMSLDYFIEYTDLSPEQLAALFSFIETNSKFDPTAEILNDGFGLCQWSGKRYENLENFAIQNGTNINSLDLQLAFIVQELSPESEYYALKDYGEYSVYDWIKSDSVKESIVTFRAVYAGLISENSNLLKSQVDYAKKVYVIINNKLASPS